MTKNIIQKDKDMIDKKDIISFSNSKYYKFKEKMNKKPWKIFYKGILPKIIRVKIDHIINIHQQQHIEKCWDNIIKEYFTNKKDYNITPKKSFENDKIIWQYWGTGWDKVDVPDIVRLCRKSVEKYKGEYTVIRLDDNNLDEYIKLPEFIYKKRDEKKIPFAFFSDIIRLGLLYLYGGVWLDATILLTDNLEEKYKNMDYFMFQRSWNVKNKKYWEDENKDYFCWDKRHKVKVLNSIIFSKKNNEVIKTLFDMLLIFWEKEEKVPYYFFFQILYNTLMENHIKDKKCEVVDDTLPHILFSKWHSHFDEKEYNKIKQKINIHKLTHKLVSEKNCKKGSFYEYFIEEF